jgi:dihydroorotase
MGTTGLETAFAAVYTADVLPLALLIEKLTAGAALLDLPTPEIAVGRTADLVLIDLGAEWEVGEAGYESKSENCCFGGRRLKGKVVTTIAAGGIVYRERILNAV